MLAEMANKCKTEGNCTLPEKVYIIDVKCVMRLISQVCTDDSSLLQPLSPQEVKDRKMEEEFFKNNPDKGQFVHWLTVGTLLGVCHRHNTVLLIIVQILTASLRPCGRRWPRSWTNGS